MSKRARCSHGGGGGGAGGRCRGPAAPRLSTAAAAAAVACFLREALFCAWRGGDIRSLSRRFAGEKPGSATPAAGAKHGAAFGLGGSADAPPLLGVEPLGVFAPAEADKLGARSDPASDDEAAVTDGGASSMPCTPTGSSAVILPCETDSDDDSDDDGGSNGRATSEPP